MNIKKFQILILAIIAIISTAPFYFWGWGLYALELCLILLVGIGSVRLAQNKIRVIPKDLLSGLILFLSCSSYLFLIGLNLGALVISSLVILLYFTDDETVFETFLKFKGILAIILFPSSIVWLVHITLSNNIFLNLGEVELSSIPNQYKVEMGMYYYIYPFMTIVSYDVPSSFYRFPGPFDEPGVVGSLAGMILCADKFNLKNKTNKVLFFSGIISFSLAFYVMIFLYFLLTFTKAIKRNLIYSSIFIISAFIASTSSYLSEYIDKLIFSRLAYSNGSFAGDNRTSEYFDSQFNQWLNTDDLYIRLFGYKSTELGGSSSFKQVFLLSGVIGFFLLVLIFILFFYKKFNGKLDLYVLSFMLIFILSFYQRPDLASVHLFIIFSFGISYLSLKDSKKHPQEY